MLRLAVSCPTASGDGKYYGRYPHGNAPIGPVAGNASDISAGSGALSTGIRVAGGGSSVSVASGTLVAPALPQYGSYYIAGQSSYGSTAYKNWCALCRLVVMCTWDGFGNAGGVGTTPASIDAAIVALNPKTLIVEYCEPWVQANSGTGNSPVQVAAAAANWWLRATYPGGSIEQNEGPSQNNMDVMGSGSTHTDGGVARDWLRFLPDWTQDYSQLGGSLGIAANTNAVNVNRVGVFVDDVFVATQLTADYQRTGSAQAAGNSTASTLMRQAYATMFARAFVNNPNGVVAANLSQFVNYGSVPPEFAGKINAGVAEGSLGYSWSSEGFSGFAQFLADMAIMAGTLATPGYYIFTHGNVTTSGADPSAFSGTTPTTFYPNWTGFRYGWASCVALVPAATPLYWPCPGDSSGSGYSASGAGSLYFDEMAINASTNAPYSQASAQSGLGYLGARDAVGIKDATSGCYYATFTNATTGTRWIVIVNPKGNSATASLNVLGLTGKHFKAFNGVQDSTTNNGATTSSVTFSNSRDGRVGQLV